MSNSLFKGAALFVGGALVGAAAALLLTPKNGEEIRKELADLAEEAKKRTQEYCEQVKNEAKHELEQVQKRVEAKVAKSKKEAADGK